MNLHICLKISQHKQPILNTHKIVHHRFQICSTPTNSHPIQICFTSTNSHQQSITTHPLVHTKHLLRNYAQHKQSMLNIKSNHRTFHIKPASLHQIHTQKAKTNHQLHTQSTCFETKHNTDNYYYTQNFQLQPKNKQNNHTES